MRKQNGITLIALVITIIVLLILASVSIAMLTGENGILNQATKSKEATTQAKVEEMVSVAIMSLRTENLGDTSKITPQAIADQVNEENSRTDVTASSVNFPTNIIFDEEGLQVPVSIELEVGESGEKELPLYSTDVDEAKIAPQDLFYYEPITDAKVASTDMSNLPQKEARITGIRPEYCNMINSIDGTYTTDDGDTYTNTNYEIKHPQITDTLIVPYQLEIEGEMYKVTEVSLSVLVFGMPSNKSNIPSIENIIYPNTVNRIVSNSPSWMTQHENNLINIILPRNITEIPNAFLANARKLTTVTIPSSVTTIGNEAFYNCNSLTNVTIPKKVTTIGARAFYYCNSLINVTIPEKVTTIQPDVFAFCTSLENVNIPSSVTQIEERAFEGCRNLANISIPPTVTSIGNSAFDATLWYDNLPNGDVYIGKNYYNYKGEMPENTSVIIKEGTTSITGYAFYECTGLTNIEIPDSVTSIGDYAFSECSSLTNIKIPDNVINIGNYAFYNCRDLTNIIIPQGITNIGHKAFDGTAWYNNLPNGDVYIGKNYYNYKGEMPENTSIIIKEGTISIAEGAFENCEQLTNITIPSSVTRIGEWAFDRCTALKTINIAKPEGSIEDAPWGAFNATVNWNYKE